MRKAAILLGAALLAGGVIAADKPKDTAEGTPIAAAGILTDASADSVTIWTDGEESPVKYVYGGSFDRKTTRGIFNISRVQFSYAKSDDTRTLLSIKKEKPVARGTVTGVVLFSNDFWVAVKPKVGPADGYALGAPPDKAGEVGARLKALQKGDTVTIRFYTDFERHRIEALQVLPKPVAPVSPPKSIAPAVSKTPTSRPEAATSQPSTADPVADKLKLAQMYIDSGMKDQAKELLQAVIRVFPNTEAAKEAQSKLTGLGG